MPVTVMQESCNTVLSASPATNLLHALFEAGLTTGRAMCAGAGLCGRCRVRYVVGAPAPCKDERIRLSVEELIDGWRLACRHTVGEKDALLILPPRPFQIPAMLAGSDLAVDIGTTRIKWTTCRDGLESPEYALVNPQMAVGSEIMSRLHYALSSVDGRFLLRKSMLECLRSILHACGASNLGVTGNSTMISLLLGHDISGLAAAPYSLPWSGGKVVELAVDLPKAYIPTMLGPFIGADISAGLACLQARNPEYPFLLADLGTNGEFVLAVTQDIMLACSVPMGPAIEGVGMCCGAMAGPGVVSAANMSAQGLNWESAMPLTGISGTGYVSILAALRRVGVLDVRGHFQMPGMPLGKRIAADLRNGPMGRVFSLTEDVFIAESDIEEMLKARAAMVVAVQTLLGMAGLKGADVRNVFLAGALGEHAPVEDLLELGFLPEAFRGRVHVAGNTALKGTMLALHDQDVRSWLADLPEKVRVLSLVEEAGFMASFMKAMNFG